MLDPRASAHAISDQAELLKCVAGHSFEDYKSDVMGHTKRSDDLNISRRGSSFDMEDSWN